jgi:transcriptional regulator with XRE-family HTH domain
MHESDPRQEQLQADSIGRRLRAAREAAGLTQAEFAEALGAGRTSLSKWELDQRSPDAKVIADAARLLNVPSSLFLGLEPEGQTDPVHQRLCRLLMARGTGLAAKLLKVTEEALAAVVAGQLQIPSSSFISLSEAYGIDFRWLLTGNPAYWSPALSKGISVRLRYFRICTGTPSLGPEFDAIEELPESYVQKELESNTNLDLLETLSPIVAGDTYYHNLKSMFPFSLNWIINGN